MGIIKPERPYRLGFKRLASQSKPKFGKRSGLVMPYCLDIKRGKSNEQK